MGRRVGIMPAVLLVAIALVGCGEEEQPAAGSQTPAATSTPAQQPQAESAEPEKRGTLILLADSEFGDMLFGPEKQAIYVFELDSENRTVCYGECADAWPPVLTEGEPQGGQEVREALLGTIERRDGTTQVTYAGRPLYYYAHEGPGEVRCHNIRLNGGLWWVVGPDGEPRP